MEIKMTEDDLKQQVLAWEKTNYTQKDYCDSNGINFNDFRRVRTKLISSGEATKCTDYSTPRDHPSDFTPVSIITPNDQATKSDDAPNVSQDDNRLEVCLPNGIILRMPIHAGSA